MNIKNGLIHSSIIIKMLIIFLSIQTEAQNLDTSKIIGENNLVPVESDGRNVPVKWIKKLDAFGWTNYGCTVTHIGNNRVLTAGHCFEASAELIRDKGCSFAKIKWGYRKGKAPLFESQCQKIIAMKNDSEVDFALLLVDRAPEAYLEIDFQSEFPAYSELTIFSHPEGRPLEWSQTCLLEPTRSPEVPKEFFNHKCDTEPGSSGALVIDVQTEKVMGIHKGGIVSTNYAGYLNKKVLAEILSSELKDEFKNY